MGRKSNDEVLTSIGKARNIFTVIKQDDGKWLVMFYAWRGIALYNHRRNIEGRRTAGRPRNVYISHLKKNAGVDFYVELNWLVEIREEW